MNWELIRRSKKSSHRIWRPCTPLRTVSVMVLEERSWCLRRTRKLPFDLPRLQLTWRKSKDMKKWPGTRLDRRRYQNFEVLWNCYILRYLFFNCVLPSLRVFEVLETPQQTWSRSRLGFWLKESRRRTCKRRSLQRRAHQKRRVPQ